MSSLLTCLCIYALIFVIPFVWREFKFTKNETQLKFNKLSLIDNIFLYFIFFVLLLNSLFDIWYVLFIWHLQEHHLQRAICTGLIIPTPEVFDIDQEFYDRIYPEDFKVSRQLIRMQRKFTINLTQKGKVVQHLCTFQLHAVSNIKSYIFDLFVVFLLVFSVEYRTGYT